MGGTGPTAGGGWRLGSTIALGSGVAEAGPLRAGADVLRIVILGKGGQGGLPHEAVDAIAGSGQVLWARQTMVSRNVDPSALPL